MNISRRNFMKMLVGAAAIPVLSPAIAKSIIKIQEAHPTTADELYAAINTLGNPQPFISSHAYEEYVPVDQTWRVQHDKITRYTHRTYALACGRGIPEDEANLVDTIWKSMKILFSQYQDKPTIIWRRLPEFRIENNYNAETFEKIGKISKLTMRLSIGADKEQSNYIPFCHVPEGGLIPTIQV